MRGATSPRSDSRRCLRPRAPGLLCTVARRSSVATYIARLVAEADPSVSKSTAAAPRRITPRKRSLKRLTLRRRRHCRLPNLRPFRRTILRAARRARGLRTPTSRVR